MHIAPDTSISSPWPMSRIRGLRSHMLWSWSAQDCFLRDALLTPSHILVPMREGLAAVAPESGEELWRWRGPIVRRGGLWLAQDHVVVQHSASNLKLLDARDGRALDTLHIPHLHRVIHMVDCQRTPNDTRPCVMLLGERGTSALIDQETSQIVWMNEGGTRGPAQYAWNKDIMLILQGNQLRKFHIGSGEMLWQVDTQRSARSVSLHLNRAVLLHSGAQRAQTIVRGIHLDSGVVMEEVSLDGYFLGTSMSLNDDLWLVIERNRRPVIEILRGERLAPAWLKPLQEQARSISPCLTTLPTSTEEGASLVMIQTGTSEVVVMESERGDVLWRDVQEPLMRAPLPALVTPGACFCLGGDALLVRRSDTGEILHKFDSFIDEPCLMFGTGEGLSVILGESPLDDSESTLMRLELSPTLRVAYDSCQDGD